VTKLLDIQSNLKKELRFLISTSEIEVVDAYQPLPIQSLGLDNLLLILKGFFFNLEHGLVKYKDVLCVRFEVKGVED
jgi:hypothetical protein